MKTKYRKYRLRTCVRYVWTRVYRPFTMGGDVDRIISAKLPMLGPYDLGQGYKGYLLTSPRGETMVVEAISGGTVGPDIDSVRNDVLNSDAQIMDKQVQSARLEGLTAEKEHPDQFWKALGQAS